MEEILNKFKECFEEFQLVVDCSQGTKYEKYKEELVEIETKATGKAIRFLELSGDFQGQIETEFIHIVSYGLISGLFDIIHMSLPKNISLKCFDKFYNIYTHGWHAILGLADATTF